MVEGLKSVDIEAFELHKTAVLLAPVPFQ